MSSSRRLGASAAVLPVHFASVRRSVGLAESGTAADLVQGCWLTMNRVAVAESPAQDSLPDQFLVKTEAALLMGRRANSGAIGLEH